ncbi:MAG TPA: enolase C-terminal domain-like protein [Drouetiella sp.]
MKITSIDALLITLPFRFAFKHNLASRDFSENLIVRVVIEDGPKRVVGYGEGIPRDYVTGEDPTGALNAVHSEYAPRFLQRTISNWHETVSVLEDEWKSLKLDGKPQGASWCAFETAILDAVSQLAGKRLADLVCELPSAPLAAPRRDTRYGAVIPFGGKKALAAVLWFYKLYGFKTVKIKVGKDRDLDLYKLKVARDILGSSVKLRVDANCAWTADEAIRAAEQMRPFGVKSYEQPVPANDLDGLAAITKAVPEQILVDESLCTYNDARYLAENKICSAFNIRVSKVGGILTARKIAAIARQHGIACHMGAQVGESGILSAAGRTFAASQPQFENYEGSNNLFLLKKDISEENLNVGPGGIGSLFDKSGLGISVIQERLKQFVQPGSIKEQPPLRHETTV